MSRCAMDMSNVVGAQDDDGRLIRVGLRIDVGEQMNGMGMNDVASSEGSPTFRTSNRQR